MCWRDDKDTVRSSLANNMPHLKTMEIASDRLTDDKFFVLSAVQINGLALKYANKCQLDCSNRSCPRQDLTKKQSVSSLFVSNDVCVRHVESLPYETEQFEPCQMVFDDATSKLRADVEVVMAAVGQNGKALQYASPALQATFQVVHEAVRQSAEALQFASPELQANTKLRSMVDAVAGTIAQNEERRTPPTLEVWKHVARLSTVQSTSTNSDAASSDEAMHCLTSGLEDDSSTWVDSDSELAKGTAASWTSLAEETAAARCIVESISDAISANSVAASYTIDQADADLVVGSCNVDQVDTDAGADVVPKHQMDKVSKKMLKGDQNDTTCTPPAGVTTLSMDQKLHGDRNDKGQTLSMKQRFNRGQAPHMLKSDHTSTMRSPAAAVLTLSLFADGDEPLSKHDSQFQMNGIANDLSCIEDDAKANGAKLTVAEIGGALLTAIRRVPNPPIGDAVVDPPVLANRAKLTVAEIDGALLTAIGRVPNPPIGDAVVEPPVLAHPWVEGTFITIVKRYGKLAATGDSTVNILPGFVPKDWQTEKKAKTKIRDRYNLVHFPWLVPGDKVMLKEVKEVDLHMVAADVSDAPEIQYNYKIEDDNGRFVWIYSKHATEFLTAEPASEELEPTASPSSVPVQLVGSAWVESPAKRMEEID
jgi:hypothetical protein